MIARNREPESQKAPPEPRQRSQTDRPSGPAAQRIDPVVTAHRLGSSGGTRVRIADIIALQRLAGNQAVRGLVARRDEGFGPRDPNGVAANAESAVDRAARSNGQPLPEPIRRSFEMSLSADLTGVRVHTGAESAEAASAVGAKAYTIGQDIHFGSGQYVPTEAAGAHLLAHEVAHTVQNRGGISERRNKLEVSSPADAAEIEADLAADAMVAGGSFAIGSTRDAIHRQDDTPPPPTTSPAQTPPSTNPTDVPGQPTATPVPTTQTGGTPTPQAGTTPDLVTANWEVDWVAKETGSVISNKSNARTGRDAAYGTLKINPEGGGQLKAFPWVNAAKSGAVAVGSMPHTKDKGGKVSSDIAYGKPPSASATVTVTASADADKKNKPSKTDVAAKQKAATAAVNAKLQQDLETMGDMSAIETDLQSEAASKLGEAPDGYTYDVQVSVKQVLDADQGHPKSAAAVPYDKFGADGARIVTITVPTEVQKLKGTASAQTQTTDQSSSAQQSFQQDKTQEEHSDETTTTLTNKVTTAFSTAFQTAWEELKGHATTDAGSLSGGFSGKLDAGTSADVSIKDFKVNIGKLVGLALAENPALALALSTALGTATIGGELKANLAGSLGGHLEGKTEWSETDLKTTLSKFDQQVSQTVNTEVSSSITTQIKNATASQHTKEASQQQAESHEGKKNFASSTETIGVKFIVGDPTIAVTTG